MGCEACEIFSERQIAMDTNGARSWIIKASLLLTTGLVLVFVITPALGFPLTFEQARGLLQIVLPVFLGYLGSATHFVFASKQPTAAALKLPEHLVALLIKGPIVVFVIWCSSAIVIFGYSNRIEAKAGSGMTLDMLASLIAGALGLLTTTSGVAVSYLFAVSKKNL